MRPVPSSRNSGANRGIRVEIARNCRASGLCLQVRCPQELRNRFDDPCFQRPGEWAVLGGCKSHLSTLRLFELRPSARRCPRWPTHISPMVTAPDPIFWTNQFCKFPVYLPPLRTMGLPLSFDRAGSFASTLRGVQRIFEDSSSSTTWTKVTRHLESSPRSIN